MDFGDMEISVGEACGVFGMYNLDGEDVAPTIYYGLYALQHRGQESAGIAVTDTFDGKDKVLCQKDLGRVNQVINEKNLMTLKGNLGVGHVRYSTAGASTRKNAQPLVLA
ncbi:MAG: amidophosphoribosyltransferase, partial [Selenomonadaceae bacterium]|nr:amidophosphoribosyltransferase [Selenomonadaceae bacterium]